MNDKGGPENPAKKAARADREERLAAALRANLRRRKAAAAGKATAARPRPVGGKTPAGR